MIGGGNGFATTSFTVRTWEPLGGHGVSWKGEGWTEWVEMNAATPRFVGHQQPKKSLLGNFDESDPKCVEKEIDLAADHGIEYSSTTGTGTAE